MIDYTQYYATPEQIAHYNERQRKSPIVGWVADPINERLLRLYGWTPITLLIGNPITYDGKSYRVVAKRGSDHILEWSGMALADAYHQPDRTMEGRG